MPVIVVHVAHAFSAQPTLGAALSDQLGTAVQIVELPLEEAVLTRLDPDLVWVSAAELDDVQRVRAHFGSAAMLATLRPGASTEDVVLALAHGADLVLRDAGVVLAAAALGSLARRVDLALTGPRPERDLSS